MSCPFASGGPSSKSRHGPDPCVGNRAKGVSFAGFGRCREAVCREIDFAVCPGFGELGDIICRVRQYRKRAARFANPVEKTDAHFVVRRKSFGAAQYNAVGHDKTDENAQGIRGFRGEGFEQLVHDDYARGDHRHLHDDTHGIGQMVANQADSDIGKSQYRGQGKTHDERRVQRIGDRQR